MTTESHAALTHVGTMLTRLEEERDTAIRLLGEKVRIIDAIPMGFPNGTGIMGAEQWIAWAKKELGYK